MDLSDPPVRPGITGSAISRDERVLGARLRAHDTWAVLLICAVYAWVLVPRVLQSLLGSARLRSSVGEAGTAYVPIAQLALSGLGYATLALCVVIVVSVIADPHPGRFTPIVVLLLPWFFLAVRDVYLGQTPRTSALMYPAVVSTLWLLRPRVQVLQVLGWLTGLAAAVSIGLGVLRPVTGIFHSAAGSIADVDKAILPGGLLIGFLTQGNVLGQFLALGLPFVGLVRSRACRVLLLGPTLYAITWTASRSSFAIVALVVVVAAVLRLAPDPLRRPAALAAATVTFAAVVVLPLVTTAPTAFTNRGLIWSQSLAAWRGSPVLGLGADWYAAAGSTSARITSTAFHGHNELVQLLVTGGEVLLALMVLQLAVATVLLAREAERGHPVGAVYVVALAGASLLEISFALVDNSSLLPVVAVPLAVLMCGQWPARYAPHASW